MTRSQTAAQTNTILSNQPKLHDHPIHQNPTKSTDSTAPNNVPNASNTNTIKPKIIPVIGIRFFSFNAYFVMSTASRTIADLFRLYILDRSFFLIRTHSPAIFWYHQHLSSTLSDCFKYLYWNLLSATILNFMKINYD